jgi:hypothetical protein
VTISNIIDAEIMPKFESDVKRVFDITKKQQFAFRIRGLRENLNNLRLCNSHYILKS